MAESSQNQSRIVGDQSKMRSLYEQLNRKVPEYDWGSEEEFMEGMQDEQNREWLHKTLTEKGKYKSSLDHFNNRLGFGMINLDPDSETGTGPVQYKEPQYSQTQVQPQQYETANAGKQYQAPAQDNMLPRVPQYPMAGMPQQQMPMYEGYQPQQAIQYQQAQPQQPIQTAAPLTEEAGAERGAKIRKSMDEKAQHKQAMYDINKAYGINDELKKMDDQYQQQVDALKQEEGTQMAKDEELKHMQMQQLRQSQAAASYVYELAKDRNKVMLPYNGESGVSSSDDLSKYMNLSDDDVASYARMAYGITCKMDADMLAGKREELQNMLSGQVLDDIIQRRSDMLSSDKTAFFSQKFKSSFLPNQLYSTAINWFGSEGGKMWQNVEAEALARAEHKYDNTWGGKLLTNGAAGTAFAYNMMMLGGVMSKGIAGALGKWAPQAASGLWAPGQAGMRYAVWDSMVNNAYWNGALRGSAALASQYVGFARLGAINTGIAMLSDPNLVNRYGNLTSVNGWLGELGCDAKKILDAYTEEGYTGAKFGLVNMATAGLATKVKAGIFDKAVKEGKGVYEASSIANHSKRVLGTKALGLGGELGFFTMQDIDRINEENRNNPDGQIGICDYEKWSSVLLKQVGFLGALKAVNLSHGHQKDQYKALEEMGRKRADLTQDMLEHTKMAKWMLEKTNLKLNADDLDELAAAGVGRHTEFSFDLLNSLMRRADGENITVYEKLMRDRSLPTTTLYKLKVAMEHQISLMGYTCDNNGRIVGSFAPIDFVTSSFVVGSPRKGGKWRVASLGRNSEVVEYKTFSSKDDAEYYAGQVNKLAKVNYLRLLETELGDTQTTVKDVLNSYADRNGIGRWDAVELYNEWLNNRENASPLAKEMASEVKDEIWQAVSRNRVQAIAKARQQVKDITGVDVSAIVSKDPSTLSKEELDAIDTYNRALWTIKKTATTDPDILAVENSVDPDTGMVRSGVTKDGRQVTVKGSGDAVVVTEKANPAEGKPAGKPGMVSAKDVQITSETPADDLIKEINDRKAAEAQAEQQEQQPKTVAEEPVPAPASEEQVPAPEPVKAVEPEAPADVAPEPVEEPAEKIRKVSVFDANTGNEYDGEDVGPGMQAGMRRVRLGNGKMMDVPAEDLTYMAEEPKAAAPAMPEQPKTVAEGVAPVAPEPAPAEDAPVSESGVKLDANTGMPTMENAPENTAAYFASNESKLGEKMNDAVIKQATDRANAAYQSAMKKTPNLGTDMNLRRMQQEQAAIEAEQSRLKQQADYWNAVSEAYQAAKMQAKMKADNEKYMASREDQIKGRALNKRIEKVVGEIGDPSTVREAVLMDFLKPGGFGLSKDDVIKELGSIGENLTAEGLRNQMAKGERKKLDLTIQSIAEGIASEHGWDVQEVRDEIIDVLTRFGGDKVKAVQELEHIADIISGRKGQYTDEQAEQMRQQALADGEDLNAPIEAEAVPEELQPSNEQAPFDLEEEDEAAYDRSENIKDIKNDANVDLNEGDVLGKIYKINSHLNRAQGQAIEDAMSVLYDAGKLDNGEQNMFPIAFLDPNSVAGKGLNGKDVLQSEIYQRQQERLHPIYEAYIDTMNKLISKTRDVNTKSELIALRDNVQKRMEQVDRTIDPDYDEVAEYWSKNRVFDIEKGEGKVPELEGNEATITKKDVNRAIWKIGRDYTLSPTEQAERIDAVEKRWYAIEEKRITKAAKACGVDDKFMKRLGDATGINVVADGRMFNSDTENAFFDADKNSKDKKGTIYVNPRGNKMGNLSGILGHETTHGLEGTKGYDELSDVLIELEYGQDGDVSEAIREIQDRYNNHFQNMYELGYHKSLRHLYWEGAKKEVVANVLKNSVFKGAEGAKMLEQAVERMEDQSMAGRFAAKVRDMYDLAQTAWNKGWDEAVSKKELMDARDKFADLAKKRRAENDKNAMQTRVIYDDHGKVIAEVDERNNIQMNLETYDSWRDNLNRPHDGTRKTMEAYLDEKIKTGLMKPEDKQQMLEKMDYWYDYMRKVSDFVDPETGEFKFKAFHEWNAQQPVYRLIGKGVEEKVLSTIVANGEYPVNLELTTDCIKRETFTQLLNEIVRLAPGALQKLNPGEITILQDMMKSYGIQTACPLCFVEGKRLMIRNWAHTISDNWNVALAEAVAENDLLNGWKPKFKTVTEVVEGKKKTRKVVTNLKEMEELLGAFGFASDDAVSAEDWDTVKSRNDVSEQQEFQRRVNSVFDILAGRRGGLLDADMQDIEAASRRAQDRMMEMERNWMMEHVDEPWEMSKAEREEIDGILADGKKVVHDKMKINVSQYPELRKVLHPEDLIGNKGLDNLRSLGDEAHRKLFSNILSSFGAGTPKVVQRAEPYAGEIMDRSMDSAVNKAVKEGGWRLFSFSDYDISKTFDIMQIFWDAEARMAKLQSYSKEVPYILFFGRGTNAKINMSTLVEVRPDATVIERYKKAPNKSSVAGKETKETIRHEVNEYAGLVRDSEGNIIGMTWSNSHSVSPEFAQEIFHDDEYNANCGATTVGVSVNHTLYSMMTPWIRQVIPFHLSGMPIAARNRTDVLWYRDFTSDQNTCVQNDKGKWVKITSDWAEEHLGKMKEFNFYEGEEKEGWDLRKRCEDYVKWCNKNKFRPKFEWALNADNYVKWCRENGYEPNKQIETEMRAHETNGIYDNYYKVIADFNPYKPTFDAEGNYTGDVKAPHKPIKGDFTKDQGLLDLMFGAEDSMLANREANIEHGNAMITKMANDAIAFLQGKKTREEIMSKDPDAFRNTEDADLYLRRRRQQWDIEDAEPAGPVRSRNFKRWFGNWDSDPENASKVVDEKGRPLVVYHGTPRDFDEFDIKMLGTNSGNNGYFGEGFYLTSKLGTGEFYARGQNGRVMKLYVNIRNPFDVSKLFEIDGVKYFNRGCGNPAYILNMVEKFPELLKDVKIDVLHDDDTEETTGVFAYGKILKKLASEKDLFEFEDNGEYITARANREDKEQTNHLGKTTKWTDYGFERQYPKDTPLLQIASDYLAIHGYRGLRMNALYAERQMSPMNLNGFTDAVKTKGHDGIISDPSFEEIVAFEPEQIKSADGNNGDYDQSKRNIYYDVEPEGSAGDTVENLAISKAESETDINPTDAQKIAGNYKKGHVKLDGYDITIETPKGAERRGKDKYGKEWRVTMNNTYGYIRGTEGVDGDQIDVFLSGNPEGRKVYVVDQVNDDGSFDEHKVMYGFDSEKDAREAYLSNYSEGWNGLGKITEVSKKDFRKWIESSYRKTKPFADYKIANGRSYVSDKDINEISRMKVTVHSWLNDEDLEWSEGKSIEEIIGKYGNDLSPVAYIPESDIDYFDPDLTDNRIYCGKAYFIDHAANHHPEISKEEYDLIQLIINNPDHRKLAGESVVYTKRLGKGYAVAVSLKKEDGKILLHKSFFWKKNSEPYKNKPEAEKKKPSEGSVSSISRKEISSPGSHLSALDGHGKDMENHSNTQENVEESSNIDEKTVENADFSNSRKQFDIEPEDMSDRNAAYKQAVESGDREKALEILQDEADKKLNRELLLPNDDDEEGFKYHRGPAPKKTFKRYAVLNVTPEGFKAAYAGNKTGTPVGVWIDAQNLQSYLSDMVQFDDGTFASYIPGDTGDRTSNKFSAERMKELGLKGGQKWLLERGGKHSSDVPNFSQMNLKRNEAGEKVSSGNDGALPHNKLIFEIEYGIDENGDLTDYVKENGRMMKGRNQGLAKIEPNQYYDFKTNTNAVGNWGIGGTFRITRLVPHDEIVEKTEQYKRDAVTEANRLYAAGKITKKDRDARVKNANSIKVQQWVGGYHPEEFGLSEESVVKMADEGRRMKMMDITYDDNGELIPLSERFDLDKMDARYDIEPDDMQPRTVAEGDRVESKQFKNWFGDWKKDPENASKVVNEDGSPKVVHHGTKRYGFTIFETGADWNKDNIGSHFGSKGVAKDFADDDKTYNVYLNIRNPWETYDFFADNFDNAYLDAIKELCDDIEKQDPVKAAEARKRMKEVVMEAYPNITEEQYDRAAKDTFLNEFDDDEGLFADESIGSENEAPRQKLVMLLRELLEKGGYDGIKYDNWYEGGDSGDDTTCWIALRPEQIKSAETEGEMANNGEFDPKNPDLRYDVEPADQPMTVDTGNEGADDMPEDFVQDAEETRFRKYRELVDAIEKEAANYQRELDWIKNGGTDKGLLTRVRHFVRNRLNLMTGTGLGPAGINNILSQLDQVGEAQDIEPILRQIQYTLNRAELKSEMDEMLRVLNTKTQSQTSRGLVKGIGVDSQTNQVLSDIRGSFRQMVTTDIDERIREVNREIRDLKKEYGIKHVEDGDAEFQAKYREMRDRYTSLLEQRNEAQKAQANETEETLTERHEQILNEMNDYREQGKEIPSTLIEERVALPIRKELAQLRSMTGTMDQIEKELQDARDALIGLRGEERTNQKRLIEDKQANLINWQRRCVLMSKQISDELKDLISEGRSKRQEQIRKQVEEENQLVKIALDAVKKNRITQRNQPAGTKEHEDKEWTSADKMVASLQESWKENKEDRRDFMQKFNAPVYSFNYLLKYLDRNHGQGDGPLYDMLMRSEHGAVEANDAYAEGLVEYGTKVDKKCKEIFGMSLGDLKADSNKRTYKTIVLTEQLGDGTIIQKPVEVTKGQALYIWLMSRQIAGIDKLRDDGWTPDKIQEIEELMGDKYKKLGTWITEEFLPQLRADKYNPTYERLYGTSMHMASHYFPIKIWDKVVHEKGELGEVFEGMPSAATGNLVMRTSNNLPIDTDLNALDVLMDYGRSMERWNAMSELTKNLNVLRHCNAFRNRIVANDGEGMWDIWMDACNLVTNNYQTKSDVMGQMMGKLQNSFMKNAIGYRFYTALKQTLSYPAFSAYTDNLEFQAELMANIGRSFTIGEDDSIWESNYQWAIKTLPAFRQRIADGEMGIEGLNDDGIGGSIERYWSKYGMAANKAVDALTVAAGARAVYNYEYKQGKKRGLSDAEAKRLAKVNAEICFNESQQSSRPEFISQMQNNRDLMSRSTVAFQNSNISYRRGVLEGIHDILRANEIYNQNMESVRGSDHEAEYKKQFAADRRKQICRGVRKVLNFGALLPGLWYIGSNLSTLWANNEDDKEKDKYWTNMMANIAMGSLTNGSSAGPLVQGLYNTVYKVVTGDSQSTTAEYNPLQSFSLMLEIMTDALKTYKEDSNTDGGIGITGWAEGMANWAFRSMGVNPETWANIVLGLMDSVKRGRPELQDAMFVLNVPGSHRKEIVNRMARKDSPAEYMRQIMEAGKIYEDGDPRYSQLMMGTKIIDDKKRHDLLQDYLNAKYPEFGEELDKINAFEKAVGERAKEIDNQLVLDGETKHSTLIRMEALNDVIESGKYDVSAEAYKRIANSPLHKDDGRLDIWEEMTAQGMKRHRQTLKSKYDRLRKECDKAAANAEKDPETLNAKVKELMEVETKIMIELGK